MSRKRTRGEAFEDDQSDEDQNGTPPNDFHEEENAEQALIRENGSPKNTSSQENLIKNGEEPNIKETQDEITQEKKRQKLSSCE